MPLIVLTILGIIGVVVAVVIGMGVRSLMQRHAGHWEQFARDRELVFVPQGPEGHPAIRGSHDGVLVSFEKGLRHDRGTVRSVLVGRARLKIPVPPDFARHAADRLESRQLELVDDTLLTHEPALHASHLATALERVIEGAHWIESRLIWDPTKQDLELLPPGGPPSLGSGTPASDGPAEPAPTPEPARRPIAALPPAPEAAPAPDVLSSMLSDLAAGGEHESEGEFTIDAGKAAEKMKTARLVRRDAFVLDLVKAAVARGANAIDLELLREDLRVTFGGRPFAESELRDMYGAVFLRTTDGPLRARKHLALAVQAAAGLGPKAVIVESGQARLTLIPDEDEQGTVDALETSFDQTTVTIDLALFDSKGRDFRPAVEMLESSAQHCPIPVRVDGREINDPVEDRLPLARIDLEHDGLQVRAGFALDAAPATLWIGEDGITLSSELFPSGPVGFVAVVMSDQLETDASGLKIVGGANLDRLREVAEQALEPAIRSLCEELRNRRREEGYPWQRAARTTRAIMRSFQRAEAYDEGLGASLAMARVWPTVDGEHCTMRALLDLEGRVQVADMRLSELPSASAVDLGALGLDPAVTLDVQRIAPGDRALLVALFGERLRSRTRDLLS